MDLNRTIDRLVEPEDLPHAKAVTPTLKGIEEPGKNPVVTGAYAVARYAPLRLNDNLSQILQKLDTISETLHEVQDATTTDAEKLALIAATMHNHRIIGRNMRILPEHCELPQKTVPGDGVARAAAATRGRGLAAPPQPVAIGDVPTAFNTRIADYTCDDIINLIIFYNDDFGIRPDDSEETRRDKFRSFLSMY